MPSHKPAQLFPERYQKIVLFFILLVTALIFIPSLQHDFVNWDDTDYVLNNPSIRNLDIRSLKDMFTSFIVGNYQPLTILSFAVEYHFFQLAPQIYHLTNVILHLLNVFLVYIFLSRLTGQREAALLAAMLFGIHPLRAESVAWITERKDVLFTFFYLLSLQAYLSYVRNINADRKFLFLPAIFFTLALLSKPAAVTLPFILLLLDYYESRPLNRGVFVEKLPFFFLSAVFVILAFYGNATPFNPHFLNPEAYSFVQRIFLSAFALVRYFEKFLLPVTLSAFYPYPSLKGASGFFVYLSPLFLVTLVYALLKLRTLQKETVFGLLFFVMTIAVNLPVLPVGHTIIADRFTYLPSVGLSFLSACWCFSLYQNTTSGRSTAFGIAAILLMSLTVLTWQRVGVWKNSVTLWSDVIAKYPKTAIAYYNRADFHVQNRQVDLALQDYGKAIEADPLYYAAYNNRGNMRFLQGNADGALSDYNKTLELNPRHVAAYSNRAAYYIMKHNYREAVAEYQRILEIEPENDAARAGKQDLEKKLSEQ
jgi:tetratricopeptide (TPR) repeat protein